MHVNLKQTYTHIEKLPVIVLFPSMCLLLAVIFEYSGLDVWWVSHFYDSQNHIWLYKQHWLFEHVLHSGGQWFDKLIGLIWLILFAVVNMKKEFRKYRKILLFFLCATAIGPILVGIGKDISHIYTPWDLHIFNGAQPYIKIFDTVPGNAPIGHAFPAGHASGGYCLLSLYFVLLKLRSPCRVYGIIVGLTVGFIFGLAQQVRGAHFPSHDFITIFICWYGALVMYFLFYPKEWYLLKTGKIA